MAKAAFVAIDFETADHEPDSACSVGLVRVEGSRVVARAHRLIRPPRPDFFFTYIHGISWRDVRDQPVFGETWRDLEPLLDDAEFLAAHNARFDRNVLLACCKKDGITAPQIPFECTVSLARRAWRIFPTNLPCVCRELGIRLKHHDALSDAEACAQIVLKARSCGLQADPGQPKARATKRPRRGSGPTWGRVAGRS